MSPTLILTTHCSPYRSKRGSSWAIRLFRCCSVWASCCVNWASCCSGDKGEKENSGYLPSAVPYSPTKPRLLQNPPDCSDSFLPAFSLRTAASSFPCYGRRKGQYCRESYWVFTSESQSHLVQLLTQDMKQHVSMPSHVAIQSTELYLQESSSLRFDKVLGVTLHRKPKFVLYVSSFFGAD